MKKLLIFAGAIIASFSMANASPQWTLRVTNLTPYTISIDTMPGSNYGADSSSRDISWCSNVKASGITTLTSGATEQLYFSHNASGCAGRNSEMNLEIYKSADGSPCQYGNGISCDAHYANNRAMEWSDPHGLEFEYSGGDNDSLNIDTDFAPNRGINILPGFGCDLKLSFVSDIISNQDASSGHPPQYIKDLIIYTVDAPSSGKVWYEYWKTGASHALHSCVAG